MYQLYYDEDQLDVDVKLAHLKQVSNPKRVIENAQHYFKDPNIRVYLSPVKKKKYSVYDPNHKKLISFGHIEYENYTHHQDEKRRENYLKRASNMRGNWRNNPYSSNNLSINILWQ